MGEILKLHEVEEFEGFSKQERLWIYNGFDCLVTREIQPILQDQLKATDYGELVYTWERVQQGPALQMLFRGVRRDAKVARELADKYQEERASLDGWLNEMSFALWGRSLNPRSTPQMKEFFYEFLGLPKQHKITKGKRTVTLERKALEKLSNYFTPRPFCLTIFAMKDLDEDIKRLTSGYAPDGRMYHGQGPAATETGRWSSGSDPLGYTTMGGQNVKEDMRQIYIADDHFKLSNIDLEQAESRGVGYLSGDEDYIEACESGDVHTMVAQMVFDIPDSRKEQVKEPYYRHFTYRDICKRAGHLSHYLGSSWQMSNELHIPKPICSAFQEKYFGRFQGIREWQHWTIDQIQTVRYLRTPFGRVRHFFARPSSRETWKEAIAYVPQSLIVDIMSLGIYKCWRAEPERIQSLLHGHDAHLFQFRQDDREAVELALDLHKIKIPVTDIHGKTRDMIIPTEALAGYNWAKYDPRDPKLEHNKLGLRGWNSDGEKAQKQPKYENGGKGLLAVSVSSFNRARK